MNKALNGRMFYYIDGSFHMDIRCKNCIMDNMIMRCINRWEKRQYGT